MLIDEIEPLVSLSNSSYTCVPAFNVYFYYFENFILTIVDGPNLNFNW